MTKYIAYFAAAAAVVSFILAGRLNIMRQEKERLQANQTALLGKVKAYRTEAGKYAASCQSLQFTKDELQKECEDLAAAVKDLGVKLRRAQKIAQAATATRVDITTTLQDSLLPLNDTIRQVRAVRWADPWTNITGYLDNDKIKLDVCTRDTLVQVVYRVPRRFLFFRFGTKAIRQDIRSSNPHTQIVYTRYIELKK